MTLPTAERCTARLLRSTGGFGHVAPVPGPQAWTREHLLGLDPSVGLRRLPGKTEQSRNGLVGHVPDPVAGGEERRKDRALR